MREPSPLYFLTAAIVHRLCTRYTTIGLRAGIAALSSGALDDTVVIAPRLIACQDTPQPNEVLWRCSGDSWRSGGAAASHPELSSFDFVDEILRKLGLENRMAGYTAKMTDDQLKKQLVARPTTYLLGQRVAVHLSERLTRPEAAQTAVQ